MDMNVLKDVLSPFVTLIVSIIAGLIGAWFQRLIDHRSRWRPLNQLLNFGKDDLLFVFPYRNEAPEAILPRTSTEDFLAMNNFISALLNISWSNKISVRDTTHFEEPDQKRNLAIICSPKSNKVASEFQNILRQSHPNAFFFESDNNQTWIVDSYGAGYFSKSYQQIQGYINNGIPVSQLPSKRYDDYAIITKVTNPWNDRRKVIWIAGIRGIGTWGAAECIKKEWRQIYDLLPENNKSGDFSALIKIEYNNCDITMAEVARVVMLKSKK